MTVMIGDTTYDMMMARDAGVAAIGVGCGYHAPGALFSAGAVTVVDTSTALGELFSGPLDDTKAGPVTPRLAAS